MADDYDFDDIIDEPEEISQLSIATPEGRRDCRRTIEAMREERELRRLLEDELDF